MSYIWEKQFNSRILARGNQYYKSGRVRNIRRHGDFRKAEVIGSGRVYNVFVKPEPNGRYFMKCDCPYALEGHRCKHMAAVLYALEESNAGKASHEKDNMLELESLFEDFPRSSDDNYMYFDMKSIASCFRIRPDEYRQAKALIAEKKITVNNVRMLNAESNYINGESEAIARVEYKFSGLKTNYYTRPTAYFGKDYAFFLECSVTDCSNYSFSADYAGTTSYLRAQVYDGTQICAHRAAELMLFAEYVREYNPGDITDPGGKNIIRQFMGGYAAASRSRSEHETVKIEPKLELWPHKAAVSFKVGIGKMYVVKDMTELIENIEHERIMKLGKNNSIDFACDTVSEKSRPYLDFIKKNVKQIQLKNTFIANDYRSGEEISDELRRYIPLYGENADEIYELIGESSIEYTCRDYAEYELKISSRGRLRTADANPDIKLHITRETGEDGVFQGIRVKADIPRFIFGLKASYCVDEGRLNRVEPEFMQKIAPLVDAEEDNSISFRIGRKSIADFYRIAIPALKDAVTVIEENAEETQAYIPPDAELKFMFDTDEGPICRIMASYGDKSYEASEILTGRITDDSIRNLIIEEQAVMALQEYLDSYDMEAGVWHCADSEDATYRLLTEGLGRLMELGEVHTTDSFDRLKVRRRNSIRVGVSLKNDLMNLSIISDELSGEELVEILKSYRKKKKYHRLKNGDFFSLEDSSIEELSMLVDAMKIKPEELSEEQLQRPVYHALYLDKMLEQNHEIYAERDAGFRQLVRDFRTVDESEFETPEGLADIMRPYQISGYKWLRTVEHFGFGGILADDMGLGKTLQMIAVLAAAKERGEAGISLIVCPASLVYNWLDEFSRFAPHMKVRAVEGTRNERKKIIETSDSCDALVTSYDLLKRDIKNYEEKEFEYQIIDEAQYIKNHSTAAAKAVKIISGRRRFALTGTPIENRLSELWSIFDYLMPGFLYSYEEFRKKLEIPISKNSDEQATRQLKRMVAPFILRRIKSDVLKDLPEKTEEVYYAKMDKKQQQAYDGQVVLMKQELDEQTDDSFNRSKIQILAELTRIRQICCDPSLVFENYDGESAKLAACMELLESAIEGEHKVLLFSQFTSMLEIIEKELDRRNIRHYMLTGATPKKTRMEMVQSFNSDDVPVFLISLKAGGTGLNLTGADVVVHYDPWWNVAVQNQATDRAHRIGQMKNVSVYKLITKGTIEEKIVSLQDSKKDLADEILSGEMGGLAAMSREELLELL